MIAAKRGFCQTLAVGDQASRGRPEAVLGSALVVGLASSVPTALLILLAPNFVRALIGGASVGQAWEATSLTDDDWEMIPVFLLSAVLVGALISLVAAAIWLLIRAKAPNSPWAAQLGAGVAAAAVPMLVLALANWNLALSIAVPAALLALVAAPWVGQDRSHRKRMPAT